MILFCAPSRAAQWDADKPSELRSEADPPRGNMPWPVGVTNIQAPGIQATSIQAREDMVTKETDGSQWDPAFLPGQRAMAMRSPAVSWVARLPEDQAAIWSSPVHLDLDRSDAVWLLPAAAASGMLVASDAWLSRQIRPSLMDRSRLLSEFGILSLTAAAGGIFLAGEITHDDHAAETGVLAGEAAVNAAAVDFAVKYVIRRQRPYQGSGEGKFFAGGSSFPSEHAAVSWAIAGVVAHEYPGALTRLFSYGLATVVTATRVTGKEHFLSDAVMGGALGYFTARQIYQRRRDSEVSVTAWGRPADDQPGPGQPRKQRNHGDAIDSVRSPRNMGSAYVSPDSWIYPLFERLAAMGYVQSAYLGIRPWTRMQCARFLEEADNHLRYENHDVGDPIRASGDDQSEAEMLYATLAVEFAPETRRLEGAANVGVSLEGVYQRTTVIAGRPLTDGYHFAQTLTNDYGRPYGQGFNTVAGLAAHGEAGMLSFFFQGEYQHSPPLPAYPASVAQAISQADEVPPLASATAAADRLEMISGSVALTYRDLQLSFGKQPQWLGPGEAGPLLASTNAPSIVMLQVENLVPYDVPLLGPMQSVFFVGQLSGQTFVYNPPNLLGPDFHPQPFIHGNKMSFRPTPNLEFGMGVTAIFGGPGLPFTWSEFCRSYYAHAASVAQNPAKRFSEFDLSYRVPGLRKWLTVYNDSLVGDEVSPIGSTRPMLSPGLYLPHLPKLAKIEVRLEGVKDPFTREFLPGFVYYDRRYRSGYTNQGNLIGSWVGRDGFGMQGQVAYWLSARTRLQCGYRYQEADRSFLEGGRLADYSLRAESRLRAGVAISGFLQYEQWDFPRLSSSRQTNLTSSLQLTISPRRRGEP